MARHRRTPRSFIASLLSLCTCLLLLAAVVLLVYLLSGEFRRQNDFTSGMHLAAVLPASPMRATTTPREDMQRMKYGGADRNAVDRRVVPLILPNRHAGGRVFDSITDDSSALPPVLTSRSADSPSRSAHVVSSVTRIAATSTKVLIPALPDALTVAVRWDDLMLRVPGERSVRIKCLSTDPRARMRRNAYLRMHVDALCKGPLRSAALTLPDATGVARESQSAVPVIFMIHNKTLGAGDDPYWQRVLSAAADTNDCVIVLTFNDGLDTIAVRSADPRVEVVTVDLSDATHPLMTRSAAFEAFYKHSSTSDPAFGQLSISRYFVLDALVRARGFSRVFVLDADVVLLTNVTHDSACTSECSIVLHSRHNVSRAMSASTHSMYWSAPAISSFTDFVWDMHTTKSGIKRIASFWKGYQNSFARRGLPLRGGFNDVILTNWFVDHVLQAPTLGLTVCNAAAPITSAGFFDFAHGVDTLANVTQDADGLLYVIVHGVRVPFKSVRLQGARKVAFATCPVLSSISADADTTEMPEMAPQPFQLPDALLDAALAS